MAIFKLNQEVVTNTSIVQVESPPDDPLLPGNYVFQLIVEDDSGNKSAPVTARVLVTDPGPTAVIRVEEESVAFGTPFRLIGDQSTDIPPGTIAQYIWTLVESDRG